METKRLFIYAATCGLALAPAAFAQNQPFTPATPAGQAQPPTATESQPAAAAQTTVRAAIPADTSGSVVIRLDGARVLDVSGQPVGRIENIVLSPVGCAEAAILTSTAGRLIPVPWTLVRVSGDTRAAGTAPGGNLVFTVNADQARLSQAPSFTRTEWPDMSNQQWLQQSFTFFGVQADGSISATGTTGAGSTTVTGGVTNTNTTLGTTATGGTNQSRIGTTTTTVPTNTTTLPPTGRPGRPDLNRPQVPDVPPGPPPNRPPENRPPDNRPPDNRPPSSVPPSSPPRAPTTP